MRNPDWSIAPAPESRRCCVRSVARWIGEATVGRGNATYLAAGQGPRRVGYRDLAAAVADWDERLTGADVPPGATVATAVADPLDAVLALLGLVATGRVAAPVDPAAPRALAGRRAEPETVAVLTDDGLERIANRAPTRRPAGVLLSSSGGTSAATWTNRSGALAVFGLAAAEFLVGVGVLSRRIRAWALVIGLVLIIAIWAIGQGFGLLVGGQATCSSRRKFVLQR